MVFELEVSLQAVTREGMRPNSVKLEHQRLMLRVCVKKRPIVASTAGARHRGKMIGFHPTGLGRLDGGRER